MIGAIVGFSLIGGFLLMPLVAGLLAGRDRPVPWMDMSPLEHARVEYVEGRMPLTEFEAIAENYLAGRDCCPACGRFPVDGYGLCQRHTV